MTGSQRSTYYIEDSDVTSAEQSKPVFPLSRKGHRKVTPTIVAGYRVYLQVAAALKDWRDHSKLNQKTPIIMAGMADWSPPAPKIRP